MPTPIYSPKEMLAKLVSFDTTSRNSNLPLIEFVREYFDAHGMKCTLTHDETGKKASLFTSLGPAGDGGIALSGHTDVVPVDGQEWDSDPFHLKEKNGRLYGRGTSDMKGFLAVVLALVPQFLERDLKMPVHIAFSYDEEVGGLGVRPMIGRIGGDLPSPKLVIVGEPTGMKIVNAHKSMNVFETEVTGLEVHSSNAHKGVNAIHMAAELMSELNRIASEMREQVDESGRFDPPYTTLNIGMIEGGTAINITARSCRFQWEFRALPGQDCEKIPDRLKAFAQNELMAAYPDAKIVTKRMAGFPAFTPDEGSPAETLVKRLIQSNETTAASYATEAGIFQEAGLPSVLCGPGHIAQAHQPNEYISLEQLGACEKFLLKLADYASGH